MKNLIITIAIVCLSAICGNSISAQTGSISGTLTDKINSETLIGATVTLEGTSLGAVTDIDGKYTIDKITEGIYIVKISFIGYDPITEPNVHVKAGSKTILDLKLSTNAKVLKGADVMSTRITNTENAVLADMRSSSQIVNGISSQQISKTQDRNASEVIRRLPGVSIMDDRFIVIRGLSERYNTVLLNGAMAPSSETDKKAFSFDIIPSSMLERVMIYKTGAPELPGEFAGGIVKIYTKNIPDEDFISAGMSIGIRSNTTFKTFNRASLSKTDWLGMDNGSRDLPAEFSENVAGLTIAEQVALAKLLPNTWIAKEK
ncbi:MAG: carboxypeptidase-like regulatory domain-containing protein, partial [Bacteroidia bacterium]